MTGLSAALEPILDGMDDAEAFKLVGTVRELQEAFLQNHGNLRARVNLTKLGMNVLTTHGHA